MSLMSPNAEGFGPNTQYAGVSRQLSHTTPIGATDDDTGKNCLFTAKKPPYPTVPVFFLQQDDKLIRTPVQSRENLWYYQHYGLFTITRKWRLAYAIETHLADPSKIYRLLDTLRNGLVSQIRLSSTISLRLLHEQLQSTTEV
ncbi:hypothetical protein VE00_10087 [Pseudogymnoascus sp. WSF 3629]|nr:hypothetical protein VE00_10087 [Pseudogymnoascus sp. WSF 3629]